MDHDIIPVCAKYRSVGTVIVRIRMAEESCCSSCGSERASARPESAQPPLYSGCEGCNRTRLISKQNSDCDSVVEKYRPYEYRSSSARCRYVNVCAAVCLLLLVSGLTPRSSAAPHRSRNMDRQRRAIDEKSKELWENPCDYTRNSKSGVSSLNTKNLARDLATQAKIAFERAVQYKDSFAFQLYTFPNFEGLASMYETYEWLRKLPFYREEVLPKDKVLYATVSEEYLNKLVKDEERIKEVLPVMYRALKLVVAKLYVFANEGLNSNIILDETLKVNITNTMHDVRAVLCFFSDIMRARNLLDKIELLQESEISDSNDVDGAVLYRDTLNYLEYLAQLFQKF